MQSFSALFPKRAITPDMKDRFIEVLHDYSKLRAEVVRTEKDRHENTFIVIMLANEEFITLSYESNTLVKFHYNFGTQTVLDILGRFDFNTMLQFIVSIGKLREVRAEWLVKIIQ